MNLFRFWVRVYPSVRTERAHETRSSIFRDLFLCCDSACCFRGPWLSCVAGGRRSGVMCRVSCRVVSCHVRLSMLSAVEMCRVGTRHVLSPACNVLDLPRILQTVVSCTAVLDWSDRRSKAKCRNKYINILNSRFLFLNGAQCVDGSSWSSRVRATYGTASTVMAGTPSPPLPPAGVRFFAPPNK
jgi:hypothetical protein